MNINKVQRLQLESWKRIKGAKDVTIVEFLKAQPKIWWIGLLAILGIWLGSELTGTSDIYLRTISIGGILFVLILYVRVRLYWPIARHCINWEKVDELLEQKNT